MNKRRLNQIEEIAYNILCKIPSIEFFNVDVEYVAKFLGLDVVGHDFSEDVSGVLVIEGDKKTIGYNKSNVPVRRRFTIAHEIGHYVLSHQSSGGVFIDNKNFSIFRDKNSSTGEIMQEREANAFAASLLMPEKVLLEEIKDLTFDFCPDCSDDTIDNLSIKYGVSSQAMTFRLSNLGIIGKSY